MNKRILALLIQIACVLSLPASALAEKNVPARRRLAHDSIILIGDALQLKDLNQCVARRAVFARHLRGITHAWIEL